MLNIFLKKCKKNISKISNKYMILKQNNIKIKSKQFLPANKEWFTNVYAYNKNYLKNLPSYDKIVSKLIKSFFFLHPHPLLEDAINLKKWKKIKLRKKQKKKQKRSVNRIWVSKAEIKHTNSKAIFTLYIYNGEKRRLVRKLKKINPLRVRKKRIGKKINLIRYKKFKLIKLIKEIKNKKVISKYKRKYWYKYKKNKHRYKHRYKKNKYPIWQSQSQLLRELLEKTLRKEKYSLYLKKLLWFNTSKFKNTYLYPLSKLIRNYYDKKIEFNLINLKYIYFNSSIFSQFIVLKLKNRKIKLRKYFKRLFNKLNIPVIKKFFFISRKKDKLIKSQKDLYPFYLLKKTSKNMALRSLREKKDLLNQLIEKRLLMEKKQKKILKIEKKDKNYLEKIILYNIKYKSVSGVRLDLAGRLSRRFVASRSIYIKKYKGTLKNIESSYKGSSCSMIRGQLKSNIEYTKITSFVRIGSFGVKGWISAM